jgi:hypothetical protein
MRGRVCSLQLLLGLASAVFLGPESCGTSDDIFAVANLRLPQPEGRGSGIYFPREEDSPITLPGSGLFGFSKSHFEVDFEIDGQSVTRFSILF